MSEEKKMSGIVKAGIIVASLAALGGLIYAGWVYLQKVAGTTLSYSAFKAAFLDAKVKQMSTQITTAQAESANTWNANVKNGSYFEAWANSDYIKAALDAGLGANKFGKNLNSPPIGSTFNQVNGGASIAPTAGEIANKYNDPTTPYAVAYQQTYILEYVRNFSTSNCTISQALAGCAQFNSWSDVLSLMDGITDMPTAINWLKTNYNKLGF